MMLLFTLALNSTRILVQWSPPIGAVEKIDTGMQGADVAGTAQVLVIEDRLNAHDCVRSINKAFPDSGARDWSC